jgi:hypothetical protein
MPWIGLSRSASSESVPQNRCFLRLNNGFLFTGNEFFLLNIETFFLRRDYLRHVVTFTASFPYPSFATFLFAFGFASYRWESSDRSHHIDKDVEVGHITYVGILRVNSE